MPCLCNVETSQRNIRQNKQSFKSPVLLVDNDKTTTRLYRALTILFSEVLSHINQSTYSTKSFYCFFFLNVFCWNNLRTWKGASVEERGQYDYVFQWYSFFMGQKLAFLYVQT